MNPGAKVHPKMMQIRAHFYVIFKAAFLLSFV